MNDNLTRKVLAKRDVKRGDFKVAGHDQQLRLTFDAPAASELEFRVEWTGKGTLRADRVDVRPGRDLAGGKGSLSCQLRESAEGDEAAAIKSLVPLGLVLLGSRRRFSSWS